jgi:hypothetical protein
VFEYVVYRSPNAPETPRQTLCELPLRYTVCRSMRHRSIISSATTTIQPAIGHHLEKTMAEQNPQSVRPSPDIPPTPVEKTLTDSAASRQRPRRRLPRIIGIAFLVLITCGTLASWLGIWRPWVTGELARFHDEDYAKLAGALSQRCEHDDSIPSAGMGIDENSTNGKAAEVWLVIEISYTGTCDSTASDPCEAVANELARIVFDNYPRVDELTGVRVNITNRSSLGPIGFSSTPLDKALTVAEWRKQLSLESK